MAGAFKVVDEAADDRMAGTPSALAYAPRILRYPLSGYSLPVLIFGTPLVWALLQTALAFFEAEPAGMVAWLMRIGGTITGAGWLLSYSVRVIERTAAGHATPPPMTGDVTWSGSVWLLRAVPYPALFLCILYVAGGAHPALAWSIAGCGAMLWPAHALLLATEGRTAPALDPLRLLRTVAALGSTYATVCVAVALMLWALFQGLQHRYNPLWPLLDFYLLIAVCHLIGFVGYHRHRQLDMLVEVGDPLDKQLEREQARRLAGVCARVEDRVIHGDMDGALRELHAEAGGPADARRFHEDLFARLIARGNATLIVAQGRRLIALLLNENRPGRALEVYENCLNRDRWFEPQTPLQLEQLAREALGSKLDDLFLRMLRDLESRYPGDAIVVSGGLLLARYWCERGGDDARALEILRPLLAHARHPQHAQVAALARVLEG